MPAGSDVPPPDLVAARLALDLLRPEEVPMWAAWWLVDGHDGEHLRLLAGLSGDDPLDVQDALRPALADAGVAVPTPADACRVVFHDAAARCLDGRCSEEEVVALVARVTTSCWPPTDGWDEPLGQLYGIDDEWGEGWGRPLDQLRQVVRDECAAQLGLT